MHFTNKKTGFILTVLLSISIISILKLKHTKTTSKSLANETNEDKCMKIRNTNTFNSSLNGLHHLITSLIELPNNLLAGTSFNRILLWNVTHRSGKLRSVSTSNQIDHLAPNSLVALSEKDLISVSSQNGILTHWSIENNEHKIMRTLQTNLTQINCMIKISNERLALGTRNGIWFVDINADDWKINKSHLISLNNVWTLKLLNNQSLLAVGFYDGKIKLLYLNKNSDNSVLLAFEKHHTSPVAIFSQISNRTLVSGSQSGELFVWNLLNGTLKSNLTSQRSHTRQITVLQMIESKNILISGSLSVDNVLGVWQINDWKLLCKIKNVNGFMSSSTKFTSNNTDLLAIAEGNLIRIWNFDLFNKADRFSFSFYLFYFFFLFTQF